MIDLGRSVTPRFLFTARGARFESLEMAETVLHAIRARIARGTTPQEAVDEWAPASSARNRIQYWLERYLAEQEERTARHEISPNHLRELRRCGSPEGAFSWWRKLSVHEINAAHLNEWSLWLSRECGLAPKSVKNVLGYFRAFVSWLHRLERIHRVPAFPTVKVREHKPVILSPRTQDLVLEQIPWERRGAFLAACHGVRPGELRALDLGDYQLRDADPGLEVSKAVKGPNANDPIGGTKTGDASWIPIDERLGEWIAWRLDQRGRAMGGEAPEVWLCPALFKYFETAPEKIYAQFKPKAG